MDIKDVTGRPIEEAEKILSSAGVRFEVEMTRPTRDFFPVDESRLYVVRQRMPADGICRLTLAAKEVKREEV